MFFTWYSGAQSRRHVEDLTRHSTLVKEKREAYFAALRVADLDLRRQRYEREGKQAKLEAIESTFPKGERVRMSAEATIGLAVFGSKEARVIAAEWSEAADRGDWDQLAAFYDRLLNLMRHEIGPEAPWLTTARLRRSRNS